MSVFQGARTSAPTTTIATDITTLIEWSVEDFDSGEWFDPLASTEYVVPAGVTALVATVGVGFPSNGNGFRDVQIYHQSGTSVITRAHARQDAADSGKTILTATTGPLAVVAGDKLLAVVKQTSGGDMLLTNDHHGSFFSVEEVSEGEDLDVRVTANEDESQSQDIRIGVLEAAPAPVGVSSQDVDAAIVQYDFDVAQQTMTQANDFLNSFAPDLVNSPGANLIGLLSSAFNDVGTNFDNLNISANDTDDTLGVFDTRIGTLENAPAPVADTSALEAQVAALEAQSAALEAQSAADAVTIAALVARVDTHLAP